MKKAQLYIITAVFLSTLVFLLSARIARTEKPDNEFYKLHQNLVSEAPRVINTALYLDKDLETYFSSFVQGFHEYTETRSSNFYFFYALAHGDEIILYNYAGSEANITTSSTNFIMNNSNSSVIERQDWLKAEIDSQEYRFNTSGNLTMLKLVSKNVKGNNIEVLVNEQG